MATTRDVLNVAQLALRNPSLARWNPSLVTPLPSLAQVKALAAACFVEQASTGTGSMTAVAPGGPIGAGCSCGASGSGRWAVSDGAVGSSGGRVLVLRAVLLVLRSSVRCPSL